MPRKVKNPFTEALMKVMRVLDSLDDADREKVLAAAEAALQLRKGPLAPARKSRAVKSKVLPAGALERAAANQLTS